MKKIIAGIVAATLVAMFTGCSKENENGRLVVKVTDAPFPIDLIKSASVTITKVELRKAGDGTGDGDGSPFVVVWEGEEIYNLLDLRNGVVAELADILIEPGEYDLVRLYVDKAELELKQGGIFNVKVPSGPQTGIKLFIEPGLIVSGGLTAELLLDFDLAGSFVIKGNINHSEDITGFNFKPVIRAVNNSTAGRIEGTVTDEEEVNIAEASIKIMQEGTEVTNTTTDASGHYAVIGLPAGTYSVVASRDGYETVTTDDVEVVAGNKTIVNFILPIEQ